MTKSELQEFKLATMSEVGRALKHIHAPADLYCRLFECLERDEKFWRAVCSPVNGWSIKYWVWFLFKQSEPKRDHGNSSPQNIDDDGIPSGVRLFAQVITQRFERVE